jgi:hypothetical protein
VAGCPELRELTVGSFNLVRPDLGRSGLRKLQHLAFGSGFANRGLHLLFPLLELRSLHVTVRPGGVGVGASTQAQEVSPITRTHAHVPSLSPAAVPATPHARASTL